MLITLLIDKYSFLKKINKSIRNKLIKTLFRINQVKNTSKIGVHDYLKFCRIFIAKDSTN